MSLALLGGIGRGISRGAEDWRTIDEAKRKKEQHEWAKEQEAFNKGQRARTADQQAREDQYAADVSNYAVGPDGGTTELEVPVSAAAGGYGPPEVKTQKTMSPAKLAQTQADYARKHRLPVEAERQTDRSGVLRRQERTEAQDRLIDSAMSAARHAGRGDFANAIRAFEATFDLDPDLKGAKVEILDDNKFAVHHPKIKGKYLIPPTPLNEVNVSKAINTALEFASPEMYEKAQNRGILRQGADAQTEQARHAGTRAATDALLAPHQARLMDAQAGLAGRMPVQPRETEERFPSQPIMFPQTGQYGWVKPTLDPKTGVASYILPKGAVAMKTPDKVEGTPIDLGDLGGWKGLQRTNYASGGWEIWGHDKNGKYRLYEASPGRGEYNAGTQPNSPAAAATAAALNGNRPPAAPAAPAAAPRGIAAPTAPAAPRGNVAMFERMGDDELKRYVNAKNEIAVSVWRERKRAEEDTNRREANSLGIGPM
jgi:hypothetical protein